MKMKATLVNQPLGQATTITCVPSRTAFPRRAIATIKLYAERWSRRYQLRNSLYEVDTRLIEKDIGLPYGSLAEEAHKPFWRE
tara:strand:- start:362 stop:610 length:249 start_codon:yes stop_codon:yes gene_type:complete